MRGIITAVILVSITGCLYAADIERRVEKEYNIKNGGTLSLDTDVGSVRVNTHSRDQVLVNVYLRAGTSNESKADEVFDKFDLDFDSNGTDVSIKGEHEDRRRWWNTWNKRLRIYFDITVPEEYNIVIDTSGGNIEVDDLKGTVDVHTSGGNIKMGKVEGEVMAKTSGGNIDVESIVGDVKVSTSGGRLRFSSIDGNLYGKTSGGSISAEFISQIDKGVELRTSGGNIRVSVPGDMNADVEASTSGGRVSTDLPMLVSGTIRHSSLTGKLNDGGPRMVLKTSGGNIMIEEN